MGVAAAMLPKMDWGTKPTSARDRTLKVSSDRLIRPPGAKPENAFVNACMRCGECMAVCPTNTLQPALGEGGMEALGTPILVPRIGPCTQMCNSCGDVCPSRAIEPFAIEEKAHLYLGTAVVDRNKCIAWAEGKQCIVCDEACSYHAFKPDRETAVGRPIVDPEICVGCGQCEFVCPVEPRAAILITGGGDRRELSREDQRARREAAGPLTPSSQQEPSSQSPYPGVG